MAFLNSSAVPNDATVRGPPPQRRMGEEPRPSEAFATAMTPALTLHPSSPVMVSGVSDAQTALLENVYEVMGHGNFQRRVLFTGMLSVVVLLMHAFAYILVGRDVAHWCRPPNDLRHLSPEQWRNAAIPLQEDGSFSQCTAYDPPVPVGGSNGQEERRVVSCHEWDYEIRDVGDSIVSKWNLVCSSRWRLELTKVTYMLGAVLLVPAAGLTSDHVGRRPVIFGSAVAALVSGLGASSAQTLSLFLMWRFFVSAATCSAQVLIFIMIYEVTGRHSRPVYGVLDTAVGTTLVPPLMYAVSELKPQWYLSQAFLLVPTAMLVIWAYELEESPIWLVALKGTRAAEPVVFAAAKSNGLELTDAVVSFTALRTQIRQMEGATLYSSFNVDCADGYMKQRAFRWRAMSVFLSWYTVNLAYYGLVLRGTTTQEIWHAGHVVAQTLLYACVCWYINNHGQRWTLSILLALLCVFAVAHASLPLVNGGSLSVPLGMIVDSLASGALSVNYGYTAEVFPTVMRSIGLTESYAFGRVGVLTASAILELISTPGQADAVLDVLMAVLALLSAVAIQFLPEVHAAKTRRKSQAVLTEAQRKEAILASLITADWNAHSRLSRKSRSGMWSTPEESPGRSGASVSRRPVSGRRTSERCDRRKSLGAQSHS